MTRLMVGMPALLVLLLLIWLAPLRVLALVAAGAGVYGTFEYVRMLEGGEGIRLPFAPMIVAALAIGLGGVAGTAAALNAGLLVGASIVLWPLWFGRQADPGGGLRSAALALAGLVLVPWLMNHMGPALQLPGGRGFVAFVIVAVTLSDTLAYLVGSFLGNWPLVPSVSPKKTVEGAVGGVAGGAIAGVLARTWMGGEPLELSLLALILLGGLLAMGAQVGDLLESKLKRLLNADDSGRFLPGHGGFLDRADAYLLVAPMTYYLLLLLH